jgi:hypothetical protein
LLGEALNKGVPLNFCLADPTAAFFKVCLCPFQATTVAKNNQNHKLEALTLLAPDLALY